MKNMSKVYASLEYFDQVQTEVQYLKATVSIMIKRRKNNRLSNIWSVQYNEEIALAYG